MRRRRTVVVESPVESGAGIGEQDEHSANPAEPPSVARAPRVFRLAVPASMAPPGSQLAGIEVEERGLLAPEEPLGPDEPASEASGAAAPAAAQADAGSEAEALGCGVSMLGQYPVLLAKIEALKGQAQDLKAVEAAQAVQWIRQAIAEFDLRPRDLGM